MKRSALWIVPSAVAIFLTGCATEATIKPKPWYGTGHIVGKVLMEDCYFLTIQDDKGNWHEGCYSEHVWNDALPDHQITITKEYN